MRNESKFYLPSVGQPELLSLDWVTENVYFANAYSDEKTIDVCNFNSGKCAKVADIGSNSYVTAISVDPINKYLFYAVTQWWVFNSPHYTLYRSNLDGTKTRDLVKTVKGFISGMTFDSNRQLLYFVEHHEGQVHSINYDGTNAMIIIYNLTSPRGLNLFEDELYFLNSKHQMGKCTLYGETRFCDTFKLQSYTNYLFALSQESRQPKGVNICAKHNCSNVCIPSDVEVRCLCENGVLTEEGRECLQDSVINYITFA